MENNFSISRYFQFLAGVFLFLFSGNLLAQEVITDTLTVPAGEEREYLAGLSLTTNESQLIVYGTVIIHGDLEMSGNKSGLTLHPGSVVIVYGNVIASNQVSISAESYFIVYGNLTRITGSNQGTADFENGDVYVFGTVDDTWGIEKCDSTVETCDYGDEEDFLEGELPPEVQEAMNCFNMPEFSNSTTCEGQNSTFAPPSEIAGAEKFQWQEKDLNGLWVNKTNDTLSTLTIPNVQLSMNNSKYRLVVRGSGTCQMGISNPVTLTVTNVDFTLEDIQGETETCGKSAPIIYTIPAPAAEVTYTWEVPTGWTIEGNSDTSSISVIPDQSSGDIKVTVTNSCGTQIQRTLSVIGRENLWNGSVNSLWEEPSNWDCGIVPTSSTAAIIPLDAAKYPVINEGITGYAKNISVETGASLSVLGNLNISGTISGSLDAQKGTIIFSGILPQTISSNTFTENLIKNIRINNPSQVSLGGALQVSGIITITQGNFISNGLLTLISDKDRTALISGTGTGNIVGAITLQRYLDPAFGYKYFSSPLKGTTVADFDPFMDLQNSTGFPHFYRYDENREDVDNNDLTGWEEYIDPTLPIKVMEGYALNFGIAGGAVTVSLSGEVNNGPYTRTLTNSNGTYTEGFNLVGNPYPSPIDWNKDVGWTKTNIDDAVYFFSASSTDPYTGTYSSHIENVSSDGKTTGIIPSMQGYFVHVTKGSTQGTLEINNQARVDDQAQEFHKTFENRIPLLRISAGFEKESLSDPTVIYFSSTAEASYDKRLDALKLMNTNPAVPSFYSLTPEKEELSINAQPLPLQKDLVRIPMGYQALKAGKLQIALQDLENLPLDLQIYLVDLEKQIYINLQQEKAYTTSVSKGGSDNRFELVFSKESITDPAKLLNIPMSVYATKEKVSVSLNLNTGEQAEILVTSLSGQVLKSLKASSKESVEIKGIRSAGVYIISLVSGETRYSKKILIK